ncbi:hypothetical protein BD289DRAFT_364917 [Coniella lustricola]|uniref:FAD/NAD(P)-binding domain-containing protein n=1 Tax=Coniella lustricola TaxID=2025994 RepID=A0A2T3AD83_9PEZI|nr:hypothetical protein BD289DRAFT_364917 [Coniella lustricola]
MTQTVVILGGSYGGLHVAHALLKQKSDIKVVLVSKSSHFYWNMASVRAIVPGTIPDEQLSQPLSVALERYPKEKYEIIIGAVGKVDPASKTVLISVPGSDRSVAYDQLVIATGARSNPTGPPVPWKHLDSHEETVSSLENVRKQVQAAQSIIVAGAGATGIELAGELAYEFGKTKEITLLCGGQSLLSGDSVGPSAKSALQKLNVKIQLGARVAGATELPDGKTELSLENGETMTTDLYLPTIGMLPNSEMLDATYLSEKGYVVVDASYRVKGLEKDGVWAIGDVVSKPRAGYLITQKQAAGVAKNILLTLQGKQPTNVKLMLVDILACAVGRSSGAGRIGFVKMPGTMVWLAKGRTLGIQQLPGYIDGSVA